MKKMRFLIFLTQFLFLVGGIHNSIAKSESGKDAQLLSSDTVRTSLLIDAPAGPDDPYISAPFSGHGTKKIRINEAKFTEEEEDDTHTTHDTFSNHAFFIFLDPRMLYGPSVSSGTISETEPSYNTTGPGRYLILQVFRI